MDDPDFLSASQDDQEDSSKLRHWRDRGDTKVSTTVEDGPFPTLLRQGGISLGLEQCCAHQGMHG